MIPHLTAREDRLGTHCEDYELAELGVDMPLGDMCRPVNQSRGYRPSTHRIRTTLAKGVYL